MRITDTAHTHRGWSGAVSQLSDRPGDVDCTIGSTSPTRVTPGIRASTTATRTTTTSRASSEFALSADETAAPHADFSFEALVTADFDCRRTKRNTASARAWEMDRERNLYDLYEELKAGAWHPGPSICFVITRPRPREVWAALYRDRIVHHLLYNAIGRRIEASFIVDSCACIPGRGTLYAARRLETKVRSITQNWSRPAFYLKCDVANFFVAIDKRILRHQLAQRIADPWWLDLAERVLFDDPRIGATIQSTPALLARIPPHKSRLFNQPPHLGLPIGNLSSQFFANIYLDTLDQFVKHELQARHYIRYVDDFLLLHESPQWLNAALAEISSFLPQHLSIRLNDSKTILQPIDRGVDFVGHVIKPWHRRIRRRTFNDALSRVEDLDADELHQSANSYFGLLRQATHSHVDRTALANLLLARGHVVDGEFTKCFRQRS